MIGADPEFFFRDRRTGQVEPVCGLIGGTKDAPLPLEGLGEGFAVQEDNVAAEYNIPPTADSVEFASSIASGLEAVVNLVRARRPELEPDFRCSRQFLDPQLKGHKDVMRFGCSPEFDAYNKGARHPAVRPMELVEEGRHWRFAGGHIHLSYKAKVPPHVVAQLCDLALGLPSVGVDKQGRRRSLYGQAGRFRPTEYGIEYRVLSNFWVFDQRLTGEIGMRALNLVHVLDTWSQEDLRSLYRETPWGDVAIAIEEEDEAAALEILNFINDDLNMGGLLR